MLLYTTADIYMRFMAPLMHNLNLHTAYIMLGRIHSCYVEPYYPLDLMFIIALFSGLAFLSILCICLAWTL